MSAKKRDEWAEVRKLLEQADLNWKKWIESPEGQKAMEEMERKRRRDYADALHIQFTI